MIRTLIAFAAIPLLAGCVTAGAPDTGAGTDRYEPQGKCDASAVQARLGAMATQELGAELQASSGARTLRWVPPRTAVTMDYRPDRLNVEYNDNMVITRISCG